MKKVCLIFSFLFMFILFFTVNTFAAEIEVPPLPQIEETNYHFIIYDRSPGDSSTNLVLAYIIPQDENKDFSVLCYRTTATGYQYKFRTSSIYTKIKVYLLENGSWIYNTESSYSYEHGIPYNNSNIYGFYYSSFDVFESDQTTLVFQKTPMVTAPTLEEIVEEKTVETAQEIIQTMKTILLCGVGCLVLLISLPIFGKVLSHWVTR